MYFQTPTVGSLSWRKASAHTPSMCTESNLTHLTWNLLKLLKLHLNVAKQKHLKGYWMPLYHFFCSVDLYSYETRASALEGTVNRLRF